MIRMKLVVNKSPRGLSKQYKTAYTEAGKGIASFFSNEILPKKFTEQGRREYNYLPRSSTHKYNKRKRYGHDIPLVYSGDLMKSLLTQSPDVNVTRKNIKAKFKSVPYYARFGRRREQSEIQKHLEQHPDQNLFEVAQKFETSIINVVREKENRGHRAGKQPNIEAELLSLSNNDVKNLSAEFKQAAIKNLNKQDVKI